MVSFCTRPAALVELGVGQLHQVERISHLNGVGHHGGEDLAVGAGEIQGGVAHVVPPLLALALQPGCGLGTTATRDDVEELAPGDVDDLGGELLTVKRADPGEEDFVEAEGPHHTKAFGVIVHQCGAIGDDGVIDRVPVAVELEGEIVDAAGVVPDLERDPTSSPIAEHHPWGRDARVLFGP